MKRRIRSDFFVLLGAWFDLMSKSVSNVDSFVGKNIRLNERRHAAEEELRGWPLKQHQALLKRQHSQGRFNSLPLIRQWRSLFLGPGCVDRSGLWTTF
jgi:hypothetical protein